MGLLPLSYRRPAYVEKVISDGSSSFSGTEKSDASLRSGRSNSSTGIPSALSFEKIINGGTCPPCTIRDFMNYLIYVEHSAENLQFFLWYRDYVKRFKEAPTVDAALSPEWTQAMEDGTAVQIQKDMAEKLRKEPIVGAAAHIFKGSDFEKPGDNFNYAGRPDSAKDPFSTPPRTPADQQSNYTGTGSNAATYRSQASDAFSSVGAIQPFAIQPFRAEIERVIATYIMDDAPRQLNLSAREQKAALVALAYTTHPSALRAIARSVESTLRRQAHPNFIRWSICNGNPARVTFARALGAGLVAAGVAAAVVLALSRAGRGWRALAAVAWVLGVATLIAAYKGMCVVLHGMHHRHVRPWELFVDEEEDGGRAASSSSEKEARTSGGAHSLDESLGGGGSNSYEEEPWVVRYRRRNIVRKIFDRQTWIEEPALRQIQDTIFVQSMLCALLVAGVLTAIFVAVPGGAFF